MRIQNDPGDQEELPKALLTAVGVETQATSCHTPSTGIPKKGGDCSLFFPALTGKSTWLGHPPKPGLRREMSSTPGTTPVLSLCYLLSPFPPSWKRKVKEKVMSDSSETPWTIQSMEFSRPEYWSEQLFPSPGGSSWPKDRTQVSHIADRFFPSWATREAQEYWSGSLSLLQGVFLTQESNQGLLCCRGILYQLSYKRSPIPLLPPPLFLALFSLCIGFSPRGRSASGRL